MVTSQAIMPDGFTLIYNNWIPVLTSLLRIYIVLTSLLRMLLEKDIKKILNYEVVQGFSAKDITAVTEKLKKLLMEYYDSYKCLYFDCF